MKIKEGFVLRKIGDKDVVIGEGLDQINFNKIIALNSSAANLWRALAIKDFSEEDADAGVEAAAADLLRIDALAVVGAGVVAGCDADGIEKV